ncbi:CHAT domain-containing protein [Ephemerocybe angulata]|uniref:CHAT domain-containing protein n=1 Tax=Ephemerocybe angulata TaxID=980116 RepID=A0A8H6I6L3_9AGAR|nr:CHAT domain-containing protein [Tulosesus angulatus]
MGAVQSLLDARRTLHRHNLLHMFGVALNDRYSKTNDPVFLSRAVSILRRVERWTPEGHPDMASHLSYLGNTLRARFDVSGDMEDLNEAIQVLGRAVSLALDGDDGLPYYLGWLGDSLQVHYGRSGDLGKLTEAIVVHRRVVALVPESHPEMASWLSSLGSSLGRRFWRTGDPEHIAEAISVLQRAVELTPDGHPAMAFRLNNVGICLRFRFLRTLDPQDIIEAISVLHQATELTPEGHPDMPFRLNDLGICLQARSPDDGTGDLRDVTEATSALQRAVELTPEGHPQLPKRLSNLGVSFQSLFYYTGDFQALAESISTLQSAVELTPDGDTDMPSRLGFLATSFRLRFQKTGDLQEIFDAISVQQRAMELIPETHTHMAAHLIDLARSFDARFQRTGDNQDLKAAISNARSSATSTSGSPIIRLNAAITWFEILDRFTPPPLEILTALDTAIDLISLTAALDQTLDYRYARLQRTSGLLPHAASTAIRLGRIDKALEWLEQGRCLVWGQLTKLRTPLDDLRHHDIQLADSIVEVSRQLENAGSANPILRSEMSLSERSSLADQSREHLRCAQKWDDLLAKVRATPGFEGFLKPLSWYTLLQHLPDGGYIIILNAGTLRCDAIVLAPVHDQPLHVPLTNFSLAKCDQYRRDLGAQLQGYNYRDRGEAGTVLEDNDEERGFKGVNRGKGGQTIIQGILRGLWTDLVKPILQELGLQAIQATSTVVPPRIWWCPTGPLSFLPLHAAGIYTSQGSECVLDYSVSSYTPTIAALVDRVRSTRSIGKEIAGLFMICQPAAPGGSNIPGTTREVQSIYKLATEEGLRAEIFEGGAITPASCLDLMEKFSSVHLACHASQDAANPLKSQFLFHSGSLDLLTILQRNLKDADLAFLSACETGTGAEKIPDEAVHLAAGMLAAGYRRVVATMWSIGDRHAPAVAVDFYQYLLDHQPQDPVNGSTFDGSCSAHALHHAIQQLRLRLNDNSDQSLLAWIPYVHFGY